MVLRISARPGLRLVAAVVVGLTAAPLPASAADTYTLAQVQQHRTATDCWTLVDGGVYNLTGFITRHEGGRGVVEYMCGIDATAAFMSEHKGNAKATATLSVFRMGDGPATASASPTSTPSTSAKCPAQTRSALQAGYRAAAAARRAAGTAAAAAMSVKFKALLKRYTALHKAASAVCRQGLPTPAAVAR